MARPIEPTPMLTGKDAEVFLAETNIDSPISPSRLEWLAKLASESKSAEK